MGRFVPKSSTVPVAPTRAGSVVSQYSIVLGSTGGESVAPMKSVDGSYLTNSFAVDNLWNRLMAFVIAAILLVAGMARAVRQLRRGPSATIARTS